MSSFNSVFYSCTNCLPNSVLYSCEHKQGFILYCISTHWTIILMRDCKENLLERIIRTLCVRFVWGPLVGAVKFESQRIFFSQEKCLYNLSGETTMDIMNLEKKQNKEYLLIDPKFWLSKQLLPLFFTHVRILFLHKFSILTDKWTYTHRSVHQLTHKNPTWMTRHITWENEKLRTDERFDYLWSVIALFCFWYRTWCIKRFLRLFTWEQNRSWKWLIWLESPHTHTLVSLVCLTVE